MTRGGFRRPIWKFLVCFGVAAACLCAISTPAVFAQKSSSSSGQTQGDDKSTLDLVRITVAHEVAASIQAGRKQMFLSRKQTPHGVQRELRVETKEATAGLLIEKNDKPLSDAEIREEASRLERLSCNSGELRKKQKQEREDTERALGLIKAFPEAFLYEPDGTELGTAKAGKPGDVLIRLKFRPDPSYTPPSRVEQVLVGMQGTLLIDKKAFRIARIDAMLFKEVSFGWGILGHLDRGGTFLVEQAEIGDGAWESTHVRLSFTGKIMMLKSLVIKSDETFSDFHAVPSDITFARGIELLKAEQARLQKAEPARTAENKNPR